MIQTIIDYLNLRVETLGRIAHLYGITEKRKRSGDDAAIPYAYVGAGAFEPVDIDNGNAGWWRPRSGFTMEPVEVIGRAVKQQRASYPLRFVAVLRRDLSVADDAFMPSRLAEDISNALNFDNGDLRNILKALNVEARTSSVEFDAASIWATEFQTSIPDLHYELAMVAVDVTVEVVAKYSCWEGECEADRDILRLFNFCDPSVVARLTPAQLACLESVLCEVPPTLCEQLAEVAPEDVVADVFDCLTEAAQDELLDSQCPVIPPCNPLTVTFNGELIATIADPCGEVVALDCATLTTSAYVEDGNPVTGTYNPDGIVNGKTKYTKDVEHYLFYNGTAWELEKQGANEVATNGNEDYPWLATWPTSIVTQATIGEVCCECELGTVEIRNSDGDLIDTVTVPSGGVETYTIPNVSWTDSDGSAESTPYGDAIVCTPPSPVTYPTTALPMKTGQVVSYASGDDGDIQAGRDVDWFTLAENNHFGNTNRFTDTLGGQTYANNVMIDWSTFEKSTGRVLMWSRVRFGPSTWTVAIAAATSYSIGAFANWRVPNRTELRSLAYLKQSNVLAYSPFNSVATNCWTSNTLESSPTQAWVCFLTIGGAETTITKPNSREYHIVRTGNISEL